MEEIHPQLRTFIVEYCTRYKIRKVDPYALSLDTSIDLDLDIFDIEIDLFLAEFAEQFHVDQSKFSWYKYGYPTGSASVNIIKAVFGYKKTLGKAVINPYLQAKVQGEQPAGCCQNGQIIVIKAPTT